VTEHLIDNTVPKSEVSPILILQGKLFMNEFARVSRKFLFCLWKKWYKIILKSFLEKFFSYLLVYTRLSLEAFTYIYINILI
jgi:hypothetical protein